MNTHVHDTGAELKPALYVEDSERSEAVAGSTESTWRNGDRVIPIVPNREKADHEGLARNALTTAQAVDAYWSQYPDAKYCDLPEDRGQCVIEQDPGGTVNDLDLLPTREIKSPRGGVHYYYKGSLPPTASKLAPHVDTRGKGSYVLVRLRSLMARNTLSMTTATLRTCPRPSLSDLSRRKPARRPTMWKSTAIKASHRPRGSKVAQYIKQRKFAIEGSGGDNHTFKLCALLVRDLGLSEEAAFSLLQPWDAHNGSRLGATSCALN